MIRRPVTTMSASCDASYFCARCMDVTSATRNPPVLIPTGEAVHPNGLLDEVAAKSHAINPWNWARRTASRTIVRVRAFDMRCLRAA